MTANITVMIEESKDILKVPATALRFTPPQEYIDEMMKNLPDSMKNRFGPGAGKNPPSGMASTARPNVTGAPVSGNVPKVRPKMGLIWIKEGEQLKPHRVRVGLTDGSYTEVKGRDLKEGAEVVLGSNGVTSTQSTQQQNPFGPPRMPSGRGGR
jgi:HlyD family secretion protein